MAKTQKNFTLWFEKISIKDVPLVGGKNAALGEMYRELVPLGVNVPNGFAVTAKAYRYFLQKTGLKKRIENALRGLDTKNLKDLQKRGSQIRNMILEAELPPDLSKTVAREYEKLEKLYGKGADVAVRSSATAEDLPGASFAGQQETYLNVSGKDELLAAVKKCIASLFTDRAISYRVDKKFSQSDVALSVGVQKMVRSDLAASGVAFTIDTETGFDKVVIVTGSYGLGEMIVQGKVIPDEFIVFKPSLKEGKNAIISHELGKKNKKIVYAAKGIKQVDVSPQDQPRYCLTDKEVLELAKWCVQIEEHFSRKRKKYQPMDIEWAKDGKTKKLFIVQARPETVQSEKKKNAIVEYRLKASPKSQILEGIAVGTKIASGSVRVMYNSKRIAEFKKGEILVTEITDPDWEPIMKLASAIVTDKGGRTSHAAIVSRELGIPCIVGAGNGTKLLKNGRKITIDCSLGTIGKIYEGEIPFEVVTRLLDKIPETRTHVLVNIGTPEEAFEKHFLPAKGVGLGRLEFIINEHIKIHPNALIHYEKLRLAARKDKDARKTIAIIDKLTAGYGDKTKYYADRLAEGIAKIAAAFWPYPAIIRFSDFKTNEYRELTGGNFYEPKEENPMIGWRGASRYYSDNFRTAFGLECAAMKKVRRDMGLDNVIPMIPFCRTPEEGKKVLEIMAESGLDRRKDRTLKVYMMCEIPSNIVRADEFLDIFDGMSIGSNDLTQLMLGLDRDSSIIAKIGNENDRAVTAMIKEVIEKCRARGKYSGICGQAPSDYPEFLAMLIDAGIGSISLNPDTVIPGVLKVAQEEKRIAAK